MHENEERKADDKILPMIIRGNILPILSLLGVFGSLVSDAAEVAEAINDNKATQCQLKKLKRHNHVMEDYGVYLAPLSLSPHTIVNIFKSKSTCASD